ncbi:MAG: peptide ABC transporter substrate-binding protein [Candidatus Tyrphobacter sp.]
MHRMLAAFLAAALLAACSRTGGTAGTTGGNLRIALPIDITNINPILAQNAVESFVDGLIFDELVTIDNHGNEVPDLAAVVPTMQNGGISRNGLTITYHLRHNVRWQDGTPFTSRDVKFTWQAIMNPNNNVLSRRGYDQIASMDAPDPYTVVLHMKRIFPPAVDTIFGESDTPYRILPAHLLAQYPNLNQVPFNSSPVGTGPYRFARWERGDRIVLDANPQYFRGAPHIAQLTLLIITDANTAETEMRSHGVDLEIEVPTTNYHSLIQDPGFVGLLANAPSYDAILFNTARAPLDAVNVRRALALAIDDRTLVRDTTYGTAQVGNADLTPFSWGYDAALAPTPYDPTRAAAMLDAAGWHLGPSGLRTKNGKRLTLQLAYGQGSTGARAIVEEVQQMLRKVGVDVQLKSYAYANLYAAAENGGILNGGKFDMTLYAWISGADPDNSSQWTCAAIPPNGNNVARYCSSQMDAAQRLALSTFDRAVRKRAYARIESLLLQDAPGAFLFDAPLRYVLVRQLQNFTPNGISEGWNAQEWQL